MAGANPRLESFPWIDQLLPLFYDELDSLFHYLPPSALIVLPTPVRLKSGSRSASPRRTRAPRTMAATDRQPTSSPKGARTYLERHTRILQGDLSLAQPREDPPSRVLQFRMGDHEELREEVLTYPHRQRLLSHQTRSVPGMATAGLSPFLVCRRRTRAAASRTFSRFTASTACSAPNPSAALHGGTGYQDPGRPPPGASSGRRAPRVVTEAELYGDKPRRRRQRHPAAGPLLRFPERPQRGRFHRPCGSRHRVSTRPRPPHRGRPGQRLPPS